MQDKTKTKKTKRAIRTQDLKPRKDAKGGLLPAVLPAVQHKINMRKAGGDPG